MGNDGGSIPTRRELVKSAARAPTISELKATALESLNHAWTHDALTSEPLDMSNVVSDWRGRLYNYETILKNLIPGDCNSSGSGLDHNGDININAADDKDSTAAPMLVATISGGCHELTLASAGIKALRDVVKLKFKRYASPGEKGSNKEMWACPVSLKELGPGTKAVYLVPCGHVFAEVAIRTIQEDTSCPECSEKFEVGNVIPILPTEKTEIEWLVKRVEALKQSGLAHSLKKDKGRGKKKRKAEEGAEASHGKVEKRERAAESNKVAKSDVASRVSGINNAMTASLTAKVLAEQEERSKRRKLTAAAAAAAR